VYTRGIGMLLFLKKYFKEADEEELVENKEWLWLYSWVYE